MQGTQPGTHAAQSQGHGETPKAQWQELALGQDWDEDF